MRFDAEVRTASGLASDLNRDSFSVTDNGLDQPIVYFAHDEQALEVTLLFDTSNSMRRAVARVAEAAHMAMGKLRSGDRVAIMSFDRTTDLIRDFTADLSTAEQAISGRVLRRKTHCCSPIQAALGAAARQFLKQHPTDRQQPNRRRAIVVITDDEDTRMRRSALRDLEEGDAIVLGVIVRRERRVVPFQRYRGIRDSAIKTGEDKVTISDSRSHSLRQIPLSALNLSPAHVGKGEASGY